MDECFRCGKCVSMLWDVQLMLVCESCLRTWAWRAFAVIILILGAIMWCAWSLYGVVPA